METLPHLPPPPSEPPPGQRENCELYEELAYEYQRDTDSHRHSVEIKVRELTYDFHFKRQFFWFKVQCHIIFISYGDNNNMPQSRVQKGQILHWTSRFIVIVSTSKNLRRQKLKDTR